VRTGRVILSSTEELAAARAARKRRLSFIAVLLGLIAVFSIAGNRSLIRIYQMSRTQAELRREIDRLQQVTRDLAGDVESLKNDKDDPARIEAIARGKLGLVKPGEVVYQFSGQQPPPGPRAAPERTP
jgi:cell division protein FtsB